MMRVVFFGTPHFAAEVLRYLMLNKVNVVGVISKPDKPVGRSQKLEPVPVKIVANEFNLPFYQPEKVSDDSFASTLKDLNADLFVVVAYGEILKQHVLDMPKIACINLHASLLPKLRGAAPIQQSIIEGEKETGITIMHMVKKMDAGDIIEQTIIPIALETSYGELQQNLLSIGSKTLLKVLHNFEKNQVSRTPQDETKVTYAKKIELEDCEIKWDKPALELHNLIRGVNPEPGAWCQIQIGNEIKRLKLFKSYPHQEIDIPFKKLEFYQKKWLVGCSVGALELLEVQLESKKRMGAAAFFRGLPKEGWSFL